MHPTHPPNIQLQSSGSTSTGCSVPQAELPVAGGVGVPVGEGLHPALEPWALHDGGGERRRGHDCGVRRSCAGGRGAACRQWRVEVSWRVRLSSIFVRRNWLPGRARTLALGSSSPLPVPGFCSERACSSTPCDVSANTRTLRALSSAQPASAHSPPPFLLHLTVPAFLLHCAARQWSCPSVSYCVTRVLRGFRTLRHSRGDDGQYGPLPSHHSIYRGTICV